MYRSLYKQLIDWKDNDYRLPLLLRGARQVGKTYLVEQFGETEFEHFVNINFEAQSEAIACFDSLDPQKILLKLQSVLKIEIVPGKTLLFLDEIQMCPQAILSLRYFKEKLGTLHVIAAGSLLEFTINDGSFSFPVGRVQFMYLKPFSFEEFAYARGKEALYKQIGSWNLLKQPSNNLHLELMDLFKEYCLVGGMPAAVSHYCSSFSLRTLETIHEVLLSTYEADFSKYANNTAQKYLKVLFHNLFPQVTKHFKFSKIDPNIRSRELKHALNLLEWAGLVYPIYASSASGLPLTIQMKMSQFKILFLDVGLLQHALNVDPQNILDHNLMHIHRGAVAEQFVGQELLLHSSFIKNKPLFYWQRDKHLSTAEVDYLYEYKDLIVPIEVKAGATGSLKSLHQFMKEKKSPVGVHIALHPVGFKQNILSLPPYAIGYLSHFLELASQIT